jgi:hypothetical protein
MAETIFMLSIMYLKEGWAKSFMKPNLIIILKALELKRDV